ncbi:MAG: hypothetical protein K9N23_22355 [Akkermansiaceae bacterium]|nr:hypothetical protein [Akkermansiaceae bacterium]
MKSLLLRSLFLSVILCGTRLAFAADAQDPRLAELDGFWAKVSRAVGKGDFESYKATCHPEGVLVSGTQKTSSPLADALVRWEKDFTATKSGAVKATVAFRFSQRLGDETTAHETGIFRYSTADPAGTRSQEYIHFEALLVKRNGSWQTLMEYQKSMATQEEWDALKKAGQGR